MLEMSQIEYIKKMREIEGCSISEIAKRLKINWRTAKKYADNAIKIQAQPKRKRESPVMGPYMYVVDAWLEEDQRMPAKQRRTAKAIYDQLKEATDFQGSYRTVRRYVSIRKNDLIKKQKEQFVKLTHDPGVAQVDFGTLRSDLTVPYICKLKALSEKVIINDLISINEILNVKKVFIFKIFSLV